MTAADVHARVCVIGGGPAGSTAARRLAALGHDVCLIERERFPRRHVGESLGGGIVELLRFLGLLDRVEAAGFLRPTHATVRWAGVEPVLHAGPSPGFQVDRGRFDELLLSAAVEAGVRVLQPYAATVVRRADGGWRVIARGPDGREQDVRADFLIDAGGRRSAFVERRRRCSEPLLALHAYARGLSWPDCGSRVEAGDDHWLWAAPLPDGTTSIAVFVDPRLATARTAVARFADALGRSLLLREALRADVEYGPVRAHAASAVQADDVVGSDFLRVGDACLGVDPLSSQGVQAAIAGSLSGSIAAHTILSGGSTDAVFDFVRHAQYGALVRHSVWAADCYIRQASATGGAFWARRAHLATPLPAERPVAALPDVAAFVRLSSDVERSRVSTIRGDVIEFVEGVRFVTSGRRVAYVGGVAVASLFRGLQRPVPCGQLVDEWSRRLSNRTAKSIFWCCWQQGMIVPSIGAQSSGIESTPNVLFNTSSGHSLDEMVV